MNALDNKKLVMDLYQLYLKGDIRSLVDCCKDDAEWIERDSDAIPFAGTWRGKAQIAEFFTKLADSAEAVRFTPREFIAEGDKVVVIGDATWTAKPTGRTFDNPWVHVLIVRDGKIARFETYNDTAAGERAFRPGQPGQAAATTAPMRH